VLSFNAALAGLPAEQFVAEILVGRLGVSGVAIGFDFHFGQGRGGSPAFLTEAGQRYGFPVDVAPKLEDEGRPVSSGTIRAALEAGRVVEAAELLGYPWFASGEVIHGEKRGRELGFPTANLKLDPACGLKHGIYAVRVGIGDARYDGVASFGRRPTFDNGAPLLEVFLFDFSGDLYGQVMDVALIGWIRPEEKFASVEALMAQMNLDSERARDALARNPAAFPPLGRI
jgi:riboflavin kinase/FMN adenylyltransferase